MQNTKQFNSLEEVREEIDTIDDQIVKLISKRSHLVRQAATFKKSIEEVMADDRVDFILQKVRHSAIKAEVSPNMISDLFKIMIKEMVETEIAEFQNTQTF